MLDWNAFLFVSGCQRNTPRSARASRNEAVLEFECPEEFGYYPHPRDCTQYYVCVFGGALLESCTGGLMYRCARKIRIRREKKDSRYFRQNQRWINFFFSPKSTLTVWRNWTRVSPLFRSGSRKEIWWKIKILEEIYCSPISPRVNV